MGYLEKESLFLYAKVMEHQLNQNYRPFYQLPFCCVPATLQWILYRNGFDILDQEIIGIELGLRLPEKARSFFTHRDIEYFPDDKKMQWGTQIFTKKYTINNFFKKYNIPFSISKQYYFNNKQDLHCFLIKNLSQNIDIILRFNNRLITKNNRGHGHFAVIVQYNSNKKTVIIGDPDPPFYKQMTLQKILYSISNKIDGIQRGFFIIKNVNLKKIYKLKNK